SVTYLTKKPGGRFLQVMDKHWACDSRPAEGIIAQSVFLSSNHGWVEKNQIHFHYPCRTRAQITAQINITSPIIHMAPADMVIILTDMAEVMEVMVATVVIVATVVATVVVMVTIHTVMVVTEDIRNTNITMLLKTAMKK